MNEYVIWWQPQLQPQVISQAPFLSYALAQYNNPTAQWVNGYYRLQQQLSPSQFAIVDNLANNHVCIDVKPSPYPPTSPTQR